MYRYGYSPAAAALAVILSRGFESSLRRGLALSGDSFAALVTRPVTALLLGIALLVLVIGSVRQYRRECGAQWPKPSSRPRSDTNRRPRTCPSSIRMPM